MRPNLSLESIAGALAVLGTGVLMAACGGAEEPKSPVNATDVPSATDKAATPAEPKVLDAKPADATPAAAMPTDAKGAAPTAAMPADAKGAAAPATTGSAKKPGAPAPPAAAKKGGASCGAGTCSAKK